MMKRSALGVITILALVGLVQAINGKIQRRLQKDVSFDIVFRR